MDHVGSARIRDSWHASARSSRPHRIARLLSIGELERGIFVERSDFPAGYIGMPHVHNEDLYVTIIKGSVYIAFGEKLDTTLNIKPLGPGSFLVIPADKAHYEWFKEPCTMQIEGMGPQSTYFITPRDTKP